MKTIPQSLIRDMLKPEGYCGHYLNEVYNNGFKTEPTDDMVNGLFFEYSILGATARGEIPEIPKSKAKGKEGQILKREIDLLKIIEYAKGVLKANEIVIEQAQVHMTVDDRSGHIDAVGTYHGPRTFQRTVRSVPQTTSRA